MKAIILAAGLGSRLNPLTQTRPKHLLPIAGKPLIGHIVTTLSEIGVKEIGVVVHHLKEKIIKYLGRGEEYGVKIEYIYQRELDGTAGAVEVAKDYVGNEVFMAVSGDVTVDKDVLRNFLRSFEKLGEIKGMVLGVHVDNPYEYGVLVVEKGYLRSIVEKPRPGEVKGDLINAGIYLFKPIIFEYVNRVGKSPRGERELTEAVQLMANRGKVAVYDGGKGWWFDVGRPWDLIDANKVYLERISTDIRGDIRLAARVIGNVRMGEGSVLLPGSVVIGPTHIGSNVIVGYNTVIGPYSTIGDNIEIGPLSYISGSIIMENTYISSHCAIFESIIGENVYLESGVKIPSQNIYGGNVLVLIKGRKVDSGRSRLGAIIGDNVRIGANTSIAPGVTIMPNATIPPNSKVVEDVITGN